MAEPGAADDATLLPAADPVSGDDPTAAGTVLRRGGSTVARVARYVLLDKLGEGGMGVVWSAYDPELDRRIAVKLIRGEADDNAKQRFIREARAMAQLHHPAIVAIHDVGTAGDHAYIAMELVRGKTLREWLKDDTRPWRTVLATFVAAGEGIAVAHRAGVVHRDFKPANVMVADDGRAVVLDFGLARAPTNAGEDAAPDSADSKSWASIDVTHTAGVVGTPAYMAPEQIAGAAFDGRADQFAFCIAVYEALFGVAPFPRDSLPSMVGAIAKGELATPVSSQRVPSRIRRAIVRGLAFEPAARWPDMDALLAELRIDRGRTWLAFGGGAIAIAATATWIATRPEPVDPCAVKDAEVAQVWTDERRAQVERVAAVLDARGATVEDIDAYVRRLRGAVAESCATSDETAQATAFQARVGVCLDGARSELDGLLDVLASESVAATEALAEATMLLPDPAACIELGEAQRSVEASAASIRRLAEADSWIAAGDLVRAEEALAPLLDESGGAGWRSRVLRASGKLQIERGNIEVGIAELTRAAGLAVEGGDDLSFVRCAVDLAQQVGLRGGDFARGETWLELAMAAARRLGGSTLLQARLLETRGSLRHLARDYDGAVLSLTAALAITMVMLGPDHRRTGELFAELGVANLMEGKYEIALRLLTDSRRILEARLGPTNAEVMRVRTNMLSVETSLGRFADVEAEARKLLELLDVPEVSNPSALASAISGLAEVAHARDDVATAIAHYERVREICEKSGARLRAAAVRGHLAELYSEVGRHADAQTEIAAARSAAAASGLAADHSYTIEFALNAVDVASAAGDFATAHALLDKTAEPASRYEQVRLNHEVRAARLAMREGKPGDRATVLRGIIDDPRYGWDDRVKFLLLLADLERLAGNEAAVNDALDRARREIGDIDAPRLLREIADRRKP